MDDFDQDLVYPGVILISELNIYMVESFLGYGAYGNVVMCTRVNDMRVVAIKMIHNFHREAAVQELATALQHLKDIELIHMDLKLDNIMLVNHKEAPFKVKLIDFGLACDKSAVVYGSYVQTLFYRAPEILLGLPFNEAIDMWSLGCIIAELFLGTPLYPGSSSYNMMRYMVETQHMPPDSMLEFGMYTYKYFQKDLNTNLWSLKTPDVKDAVSWEARTWRPKSLDDILHIWPLRSTYYSDVFSELLDLSLFADIVKAMLQLDASLRITPQEALSHPFTNLSFFSDHLPNNYTWSCFDAMKCYQHPVTSYSAAKVYEKFILDSPESFDLTLNQPNNPDPSTSNASYSQEEENEIIPGCENVTIERFTWAEPTM
ncbi:Homeodomain-interacting protein kinase 3 [Takifugu flavidus]|uniref:Homeodomain-interacting protein kinase 3 n=1 Tax=Takifugu flavidus TaxID=433684 RepID=A0A5C6MTC5_9TELE|nr:Homeodomain-interacting protein kinase 3 [Takifugu flavidus]